MNCDYQLLETGAIVAYAPHSIKDCANIVSYGLLIQIVNYDGNLERFYAGHKPYTPIIIKSIYEFRIV